MGNAAILRDAVAASGLKVFGGINAPYIWVKGSPSMEGGPSGATSWQIFDRMLKEANIVVTPGSGFGRAGEGYFRISAFNSREKALEAAVRLKAMVW